MRYAIHTLLARTAHAQRNFLRPYLRELDLSPGQPKVLRELAALGPVSQRELALYCEVDLSAICRTLDSLERAGLLVRKPDPADRRSGRVELTPRGHAALERWEARCRVIEEQMLRGFSPQEREQLAGFLERAYRNVGGRLGEVDAP